MFYSSLLLDKTDQHYNPRARRHDRQLVDKHNKLFSNNFMIRMCCILTVTDLCISCILTTLNKDDDDDDEKICIT